MQGKGSNNPTVTGHLLTLSSPVLIVSTIYMLCNLNYWTNRPANTENNKTNINYGTTKPAASQRLAGKLEVKLYRAPHLYWFLDETPALVGSFKPTVSHDKYSENLNISKCFTSFLILHKITITTSIFGQIKISSNKPQPSSIDPHKPGVTQRAPPHTPPVSS